MGRANVGRITVILAMALVGLALGASPAFGQGQLDANCPGPAGSMVTTPVNGRVAQTFTAQSTGTLVEGSFVPNKASGSSGDYVIQILSLDGSGSPTNTVLATATIPNPSVPNGFSTITGTFNPPATVVAGQSYALGASRPGPSSLTVAESNTNACPGAEFTSGSLTGPWVAAPAQFDMLFAVYVQPEPTNAFNLTGTTRNKKNGTATLSFNLPFAGELSGSGTGASVASGRAVTSKAVSAGVNSLSVKATGKKRKGLNSKGKAKLTVGVTYTPTGGKPATQTLQVKLIKRKKG
jgi:hypothetical protein